MGQLPDHLTPERWMAQMFASAEALKGGVVKRQIRDVERLVGREVFAREVARRGFQAVENGRHFVVFCNGEPIRRVCVDDGASRSGPMKSVFEHAS